MSRFKKLTTALPKSGWLGSPYSPASPPFSLYLHYPFCIQRCPYCGFATEVEKEDLAHQYREMLKVELTRRASEEPWRGGQLHTVYFGGGTPSLMPPDYFAELMGLIGTLWELPPDAEVTLEANPETRDVHSFAAFRKGGANRLSIGAQSFEPAELQLLGRAHSAEGVFEVVNRARAAGFDNLSLDLIYGIPGQTVDSFRRSVEISLSLGIEHLSAYTLSIEEGTPFARSVRLEALPQPDPDRMADQYACLIELMTDAGFEHYELTNYAGPGFWSRHNSAYWQRMPYLGVGCGSHSFDGRRRYWNRRDTSAHIALLEEGGDPTEGEERLGETEIIHERVYLSLRTREGLPDELARRVSRPEALEELEGSGFLERRGDRWHVPESRWLLLDEVVLRLLEKRDGLLIADC